MLQNWAQSTLATRYHQVQEQQWGAGPQPSMEVYSWMARFLIFACKESNLYSLVVRSAQKGFQSLFWQLSYVNYS